MRQFGDRLQGDLVTQLKSNLQTQPDSEVRTAILELVMHSKDPRFVEFCELAKDDQDPRVRAFAGTMLIDNGHVEGFQALTSGLPALKNYERMNILPVLLRGIDRMKIPFVDSKGNLRPRPKSKEELPAFFSEWSEWWRKNGAALMEGSKTTVQPIK